MTEFFVFIITLLAALACALIGNFLILRKLSLIGDAISHAVLFGVLLAFFIVGGLDSPLFFIVSVLFSAFMAFMIQWISVRVRISSESIIGLVFTAFFAFAVILLVKFARDVHLDQHSVLYGNVEFSAWNRLIAFGIDFGPQAVWVLSGILLLNLLFISLFYKELAVSTFDPVLSESLGFSLKKIDYLLIFLVSITVVSAFEVAGAVLIVALLVVPSATAYVLAGRLFSMILLSLLFAFLSVLSGYFLAFAIDGSIAGAVATMSGVILFLVVFIKKQLSVRGENHYKPL